MNTLGKHSLNVFLKLNLGNFCKSGGMLFHSLAPDLPKDLNWWFDLE